MFALPEVGGGIVLTAPQLPVCSILIQKLDAQEFIKQVNFWFDPQHSPFEVKENSSLPNGEIKRQYKAKIGNAHILLIMNVRAQPNPGGMQAMLTAGRSNE